MVTTTRIEVWRGADGRARVRLEGDALRARRLPDSGGMCRVALVATVALLLGGDTVAVEIVVGDGTALEVVEPAGVVAFYGRGRPAGWRVRACVGAGARLVWDGRPFVVASGAAVTRSTALDVAAGGVAIVRETLVLGRTGERGGSVVAESVATLGGAPALCERLVLDPAAVADPACLGGARCVDAVTVIGARSGAADALQLAATGSIERDLVAELHETRLEGRVAELLSETRATHA